MDGGKPGIGVFGAQGDEVGDFGDEVLLVSLGNWLDGVDGFSCCLLQAESPSSTVVAAARLSGREVALAMAFRTPLPL
jgi:hypothetical protein